MKLKFISKFKRRNQSEEEYTNYLKDTFKIVISGILAFLILNTLCLFYFNVPIHDENYSRSSNKTTNYKYEPMKFYTRAIEGYGIGKINNDGYANLTDYCENKTINVLVMGSSQVEAFHVNINDKMSTLLNNMLDNKFVYNIGISGHDFLTNSSNLRFAVNKYKPVDYIILETADINLDKEQLKLVIDGQIKYTDSDSKGILGIIRKNYYFRTIYRNSPFLKLVFQQVQGFKKNKEYKENEWTNKFDTKLTNDLLQKLKSESSIYGAKLIIMYHPSTILNNDGSLTLSSEQENVDSFAKLCKNNNIYFLDMSERFKMEYEKNHILPYGFHNTSVGSGHLNKYGHKMIAEELYNLIEGVK